MNIVQYAYLKKQNKTKQNKKTKNKTKQNKTLHERMVWMLSGIECQSKVPWVRMVCLVKSYFKKAGQNEDRVAWWWKEAYIG